MGTIHSTQASHHPFKPRKHRNSASDTPPNTDSLPQRLRSLSRPEEPSVKRRTSDLSDAEHDRKRVEHDLYKWVLCGHAMVPLHTLLSTTNTNRCLAVGVSYPSQQTASTDAACWISQVVKQYATTQWTLLLPPQTTSMAPDAYQVVEGWLSEGLDLDSDAFIYITHRMQLSITPTAHWMSIFYEQYRLCAPGGWCEWVESLVLHQPVGEAGMLINQWIQAVADREQVALHRLTEMPDMIASAGFVQVTVTKVSLPTGEWGGHPGRLAWANWNAVIRGLKSVVVDEMQLVPGGAWEFEKVVSRWMVEVEERHSFSDVLIVQAKKPDMSP